MELFSPLFSLNSYFCICAVFWPFRILSSNSSGTIMFSLVTCKQTFSLRKEGIFNIISIHLLKERGSKQYSIMKWSVWGWIWLSIKHFQSHAKGVLGRSILFYFNRKKRQFIRMRKLMRKSNQSLKPIGPPMKYQIFYIYINEVLCSRHLNEFLLVSWILMH